MEEDRLEEFRAAFSLFDKDGRSYITIEQLKSVMTSLGKVPTRDELKHMAFCMHRDGKGEIDFPEFVSIITDKMKETDEDIEIKEAFTVFDEDGDGFISVSELQSVMKFIGETLTDEEVRAMLNEADLNGDGQISYDEFLSMMMQRK